MRDALNWEAEHLNERMKPTIQETVQGHPKSLFHIGRAEVSFGSEAAPHCAAHESAYGRPIAASTQVGGNR